MFGESRPAAGGADRALERPRELAAAGSVAQQRIDWPAIAGDVARALLGDPNARMSTAHEARYGTRGSLAVHVGRRPGRDVVRLRGGRGRRRARRWWTRERGSRAAALAWLEAEEFIGQRDPALTSR